MTLDLRPIPDTRPTAVSAPFVGAWPTAVPGATTGYAFTCTGGVLRGTASATAWTTNAAVGLRIDVYLDGVKVGEMLSNPSLVVNIRTTLPPAFFAATITAGTHYLAFRIVAGSTSADDRGGFFGVVTPT